ncbi:MAG: SDR family oxidoreductase [Verrucomicrobiae bacterium]|nr:SDR family oxidoreductase [Verrucomicrobiae bacterium]
MRILLAGCGYLGLALGARLATEGHHVTGLRRSPDADSVLRKAGIEPWIADFTQAASLASRTPDWDWVVHCGAPDAGDPDAYRATYLEGSRQLLAWLRPRPPSAYVFTGSTAVYAQTDGSWVTEDSPTTPESATARILLESEGVLRQAATEGFPARILRISGIYGPGRNRVEMLRRGAPWPSGDPQRWLNMVHRDDLVEAILLVAARGVPGSLYNVSDLTPVRAEAFEAWLAERLGPEFLPNRSAASAARSARGTANRRIDTVRLRRELGWQPRYPSFREGYAAWVKP